MFDSETELVRYKVIVNDCTNRVHVCDSFEQAIMQVKNYLYIGVASRAVEERGYYVKQASAMSQSGEWVYTYALVWKQVN